MWTQTHYLTRNSVVPCHCLSTWVQSYPWHWSSHECSDESGIQHGWNQRCDNEETTAQKHFTLARLALRCEQTTLGTADKVIYCNAFAQKEMVLLEYPLAVVNGWWDLTRSRATCLLTYRQAGHLGSSFSLHTVVCNWRCCLVWAKTPDLIMNWTVQKLKWLSWW